MLDELAELWRSGNTRAWSRAWWKLSPEEREAWTLARASKPEKMPKKPSTSS